MRHVGTGRVTSLVMMATFSPGRTISPSRGVPMGLRSARHLFLIGERSGNLVARQNLQKVLIGHLHGLNGGAEAKIQPHTVACAGNFLAPFRSALTTGSSSPVRKRISAPPPVQR